MIQEAFEYSEKYGTPVFFSPTTRVCHAYASVTIKEKEEYISRKIEGFVKDLKRWVIFPKLSYNAHIHIEKRNEEISKIFSDYDKNIILNENGSIAKKGIATHGISYSYVMDGMKELDPVIEKDLVYVCGKYKLNTKIYGKITGNVAAEGENTCDSQL